MSVQPEWARSLTIQQQSVLLLAARGPDGVEKFHPCKAVVRAYRGTVLVAARYGRPLHWGERADTFMSLDSIANPHAWQEDCDAYFAAVDSVPHHYQMHLLHGAEILGYKHPDINMRTRWGTFYLRGVDDMHLQPESEAQMDARLSDWNRQEWEGNWIHEA